MIKERKKQVVEDLKGALEDVRNLYLADISGLNASETSDLRRTCFSKKIKPSTTKGTYIKSIFMSSTMSQGISIDTKLA